MAKKWVSQANMSKILGKIKVKVQGMINASKTELEAVLDGKADANDVWTKDEMEDRFPSKTDFDNQLDVVRGMFGWNKVDGFNTAISTPELDERLSGVEDNMPSELTDVEIDAAFTEGWK